MKYFTLKMRIMLFTGIIVLFTAGVLTLLSMYNMNTQIGSFTASIQTTDADAVETEMFPTVSYSYTEGEAEPEVEATSPSTDKSAYHLVTAADGGTVTVTLKEAEEKTKHNYNVAGIAAMVLVAALSMAVAYFVMGKSLQPICQLSDAVSGITENDLSVRLPQRRAKDEISSLTDSFNAMLDRLHDAFERQKRFSFNAAHELKTPLACMKTGLQTLQLEAVPSDEDYREVFDVLKRNTERLAEIVDDLLALTNEGAELPEEIVSLNALLTGIVRDLAPQYAEKKIEIKYEFPQKECFISCAEALTYRLFYNLIENALKYNRMGGTLLLGISEAGEQHYAVRVKDTGVGISDDCLPHIWEAFYCVDPSRSKKLGGAGLGLSVVKEIADRFDWSVSVSSVEKVGTQFVVELKK